MQSTDLDRLRDKDGKLLKGAVINPAGKGGFQERPQDISPGGWKKENTISYQYNRFMSLKESDLQKTVADEKKNDTWTVAMDLAYRRVVAAQKSLPDVKEITDRTEGKAPQSIDVTTGGDKLNIALVEFVDGTNKNSSTNTD